MPHSDIHGSKPARGSPWLFAACHVLHRLLVPRHPPNALIILDICPQDVTTGLDPVVDPRVPDQPPQEPASPCTETIPRALRIGFWKYVFSAHKRLAQTDNSADRSRDRWNDPSDKVVHTPLNPCRRPLGCRSREQQFPVRQFGRTTGPPPNPWSCNYGSTSITRVQRRTRT